VEIKCPLKWTLEKVYKSVHLSGQLRKEERMLLIITSEEFGNVSFLVSFNDVQFLKVKGWTVTKVK